ncbi:MAG: LLM class flavin-dependent oxidoreductase [Rhodococcus sp. (in: high G+C Gram-positive bacteria)]
MKIDLTIYTPGARVADIVDAAQAADDAGFAGVSFWDQLSGKPFGATMNHECWTLMTAVAARTSRVEIGSLVMNIANRDPGTTAVAAATLQELSRGRLWLGFGAGTGADSPFAAEQHALGRPPKDARERRGRLITYLSTIRRVWGGGDEHGFGRPHPVPPLVVGCFGRVMAATAGREADGLAVAINGYGEDAAGMEELFYLAARSRAEAGLSVDDFERIAHTAPSPMLDDEQFAPTSPLWRRLENAAVDRLVIVAPPSAEKIRQAAGRLPLGDFSSSRPRVPAAGAGPMNAAPCPELGHSAPS